MAVEATPDPLDRAAEAMREEDPPGWTEISQSVLDRVRSLVVPAATVLTYEAGSADRGDRGSTVRVSTRILVPGLRRVVDTDTRATDSVDITVTDDRVARVNVELVCSYGSDLQNQGVEVRTLIAEALREVVGDDPDFDPERDVTVEIVDVVEGDPHRT